MRKGMLIPTLLCLAFCLSAAAPAQANVRSNERVEMFTSNVGSFRPSSRDNDDPIARKHLAIMIILLFIGMAILLALMLSAQGKRNQEALSDLTSAVESLAADLRELRRKAAIMQEDLDKANKTLQAVVEKLP